MADLDTDAIRADMDEPMSILGYRRRLQDALAEIDALRADLEDARAALAEATAQRDLFRETHDMTSRQFVAEQQRAERAEARLAAVLALCNDGRLPSCGLADRDYDGCYVQDVVQKIRAAARGEGDRG